MKSAPLLIELLTEELPPKALRRLGEAFANGIFASLQRLGFVTEPGKMIAYMTPRRLAVLIEDVLSQQPTQMIERKGPSKAAAFDADGKPTKALEGFMRSCQTTVDQLEETADGQYVMFRQEKSGESLESHLSDVVENVAKTLPIPKLMHWGDTDYTFVRPVHGLIMLLGDHVIPGSVLGQQSQQTTAGHRFLGQSRVTISSAEQYESILETQGSVIASFEKRQMRIKAGLLSTAKEIPGANSLIEDDLLDEVTGLVEFPAVYRGQFDEAFLSVPQECLILSMTQHQKYFPLMDDHQRLMPFFLIVSNMAIEDPKNIISGNERVLRARLSDARFFYEQDIKTPLLERLEGLKHVVYHNQLGSQYDRVKRLEALAVDIANQLTLSTEDEKAVDRAALLCKADLITDMVGEFPELQGIMGRYYALADHEPAVVATAIEQHYWPKFSGDGLPNTQVAVCCALADRLDILVGIFGIGLTPTGDKDPFGLRRHALAVIRILLEHQLPLSLRGLLETAFDKFDEGQLQEDTVSRVYQFMLERLKYETLDRGYPGNIVEAVLSQQPDRLDDVLTKMNAVKTFIQMEEAASLSSANKRIINILKKNPIEGILVDATLFSHDAEKRLYEALLTLEPLVDEAMTNGGFTEALKQLSHLKTPIDAFFDQVMVIDEDMAIRQNRLALLKRLADLTNGVADLSKLAG